MADSFDTLVGSVDLGGNASYISKHFARPANPLFMGHLNNSIGEWTPRIEVGVVAVSTPYTHVYQVIMPGEQMRRCVMLSETLVGVGGIQTSAPLPIGTKVLVLALTDSQSAQHNSGVDVIFGVLPQAVQGLELPYMRVPGFRGGFFGDDLYRWTFQGDNAISQPYGNGRMADILPGEWAKSSMFGAFVAVEQFMASLGVSPMCGIFASYFNNMLRVAGSILRTETDSSEHWLGVNERECLETLGVALYPWEALGAPAFGIDPVTAETSEERQQLGQDRLPLEPTAGGLQRPIFRDLKFGAYLGDMQQRWIMAPYGLSSVLTADSAETPATAGNFTGLFHELIATDGSYTLSSAREITFRKTSIIPAPIQRQDPFSWEEGDCEDNYDGSGITKEGTPSTAHNKINFEWVESSTLPEMIKTCGLKDYHAWMYNRYYNQTITTHTRDWYLQEPGDSPLYPLTNWAPIMSTQAWITGVPSIEMQLDHRTENDKVKYYGAESYIKQLPDGGIVLEDGYGSQICMSGGNITISCPGDVYFKPGRSSITWAPNDIILRAGHATDITTSKGDLRLKAEKNMYALSNNGGVLLESRGPEVQPNPEKVGEESTLSGIILKAVDSTTHIYGKSLYAKATSNVGNGITLDAGYSNLMCMHQNFYAVGNAYRFAVGLKAALDENVNIGELKFYDLNETQTYIPNTIYQDGNMLRSGYTYLKGSLTVNGAVQGTQSIVCAGTLAHGSKSPQVGSIDDDSKRALREQASSTDKAIEQAITNEEDAGPAALTLLLLRALGDIGGVLGPGHPQYVGGFGFSFRTSEEYLASVGDNFFKVFNAPWQDRLIDAAQLWEEPVVKGPNPETGLEGTPHPGYTTWAKTPCLHRITSLTNYSENGQLKARDEMEPRTEGLDNVEILADDYKVSYQGGV